jgi:anti-anti-sigma factor
MPSSTANFREVGTVSIVDLRGLLMLGESSAVLGQAVRELIRKQRSKIILNFRDVTAIDSASVGELVAADTATATIGGRLKLCGPAQEGLRHARTYEALKSVGGPRDRRAGTS